MISHIIEHIVDYLTNNKNRKKKYTTKHWISGIKSFLTFLSPVTRTSRFVIHLLLQLYQPLNQHSVWVFLFYFHCSLWYSMSIYLELASGSSFSQRRFTFGNKKKIIINFPYDVFCFLFSVPEFSVAHNRMENQY